jgi:sulfate permease, SulP family
LSPPGQDRSAQRQAPPGSTPATIVPSLIGGWMREAVVGTIGSLSVLAVVLTLGLLAFSPLGAQAGSLGLPAAFVTAALGGVVYGVLGRSGMPAAGPSSATALILSGLVATLVADPRLAPASAAGVAAIVSLCGATVMLCGLLQVALAWSGVVGLVRFVPQPVLAGFMNGVALLILAAQLPLLLGLPVGGLDGWQSLTQAQPGALGLGLATAALLWTAARRWPRAPAVLWLLVAGTVLHAALGQVAPEVPLGGRIGSLPPGLPGAAVLPHWLGADGLALLQAHAVLVFGTATALALIGALETSLNNLALDQRGSARHDPRRELAAIGCANLICGALGGLPVVALRARALAILQAGGRGPAAAVGGSVTMGLLYLLGGPLLAWLPLPVLAGIMLVIAVGLVDRWSGRLLAQWWAGGRSRDLRLSVAVVVLVCGITLWQGFVVGVALGVLLSMVVFILRMNRSLLRTRTTAAARPSRRVYPGALEARLRPLREQITIFELEGALFFGSGERLITETDALDPRCRALVLDLSRVGTIDETGAVLLQQLMARLRGRGIDVLLAGVGEGSPQASALRDFGATAQGHPDLDRAVEAAEQLILGGATFDPLHEVPLAESLLLSGLDAAGREIVCARLQHQPLAAGETLFAEGDAADRLYVLTRGSVSVLSAPEPGVHRQRYLSISPGMMFGEMAMLDGGGRSAGVVADSDATVAVLTQDALDAIAREHPVLASHLYRNVAVHLSERLRSAAAAWHASTR